jgi:hypothetical protein
LKLRFSIIRTYPAVFFNATAQGAQGHGIEKNRGVSRYQEGRNFRTPERVPSLARRVSMQAVSLKPPEGETTHRFCCNRSVLCSVILAARAKGA